MSKKSKGIIKAEEHGRQWTKKMKKASSVEDILDAYGLLKVWKNSSSIKVYLYVPEAFPKAPKSATKVSPFLGISIPVKVPVLTSCPVFIPMPVLDNSLANHVSGINGCSKAFNAVPFLCSFPLRKRLTSLLAISMFLQSTMGGP